MNTIALILLVLVLTVVQLSLGFSPQTFRHVRPINRKFEHLVQTPPFPSAKVTALNAVPDIDVISLVAGQENYGLAVVCVGEALWSFLSAPSLSHAKILLPAAIAATILVVVSGPMISSGDIASVGTGLWIATAVSTGLGVSYIARLLASFSPSPKEIAALGLLFSVAGFFSFTQNLLVDGFVSLPSLPSIDIPAINFDIPNIELSLPSLPSVELPEISAPNLELSLPSLPSLESPDVDIPIPNIDMSSPTVPALDAQDVSTLVPNLDLPTSNAPTVDSTD